MLKVLLVGDYGKTSLMFRLARNEFDYVRICSLVPVPSSPRRSTTICDFLNKMVNVNGEEHSLVLWDMNGSERFIPTLAPVFCRDACLCLMIFAVDNMESFMNLEKWRTSFLENSPNLTSIDNFLMVLVGNKADLISECDQVTQEVTETWCKELGGLPYIETSVKNGSGVYEAFETATKRYFELDLEEKKHIQLEQNHQAFEKDPPSSVCNRCY